MTERRPPAFRQRPATGGRTTSNATFHWYWPIGQMRYLWRAVDQDDEVVDVYLLAKRDGPAAQRFFRRLLWNRGDSRSMPQSVRKVRKKRHNWLISCGLDFCHPADSPHSPTKAPPRISREVGSVGQQVTMYWRGDKHSGTLDDQKTISLGMEITDGGAMLKLVPVTLILFPILFCIAAMMLAKRRYDSFVNPLTKSMRRPPGTQLGRELGREQLEVGFAALGMVLSTIVPMTVFVQFQNRLYESTPMFFLGVVIIGWAVWLAFSAVKFVNRFHRIRQLRLGYECELAVGQELDLLMLKGFRVFHDVPAERFNIDHVVIGPPRSFCD